MHSATALRSAARLACALALACAWAALGTGCATMPRAKAPMTTGTVLDKSGVWQLIPHAIQGDKRYAVIHSAWLRDFYGEYRAELCRLGIVKWDERYDCNRFAGFYAELARVKFFASQFYSWTNATAPAIAPYWYIRDNDASRHAIVVALTERGAVFVEPQTGAELQLSQHERATGFLAVF